MIPEFHFKNKQIRIPVYIYFSYVHPNMFMKTFRQIYKTPLYINVDVSIKPDWQGLVELANISQESETLKKEFLKNYNFNNLNKFEEVIEKDYKHTLIQDI